MAKKITIASLEKGPVRKGEIITFTEAERKLFVKIIDKDGKARWVDIDG